MNERVIPFVASGIAQIAALATAKASELIRLPWWLAVTEMLLIAAFYGAMGVLKEALEHTRKGKKPHPILLAATIGGATGAFTFFVTTSLSPIGDSAAARMEMPIIGSSDSQTRAESIMPSFVTR